MIEFDVEWYGSQARPSALCDYLELLALKGTRVSEEIVADFVRDAHITQLLRESIVFNAGSNLPSADEGSEDLDLSDSIDAAHEVVRNALAELHERHEVLAGRYPYDISVDSDAVLVRKQNTSNWSSYDSLLLLTIAHANELVVPSISLTDLFERIVEITLGSRGLATARLQNEGSDYPSRVKHAAQQVHLMVNTTQSSYRRHAVDGGTDLLSNLWPDDYRPGGTQLIGQATCAKSDQWERKMTEPKPSHWKDMLGSGPSPLRYLAIPHHVGSSYRRHLLGREDDVDVMDRLRLVLVDRRLLDDERIVCDHVAAQQVALLT